MKVKMLFRAFLSAFMFFIFFNFALAEEITAPSAVAVDAKTGKILYGKNPHLKLAPASTTKLVTVMVALDNLSPEKKIKISNISAKTQSVSPKLNAGDIYTVRDLVYLALMRSVNSATVALAEAVSGNEKDFVKLMNDKVKKIGANDTRFVNSSGLPGQGQYTTAYDLTKIMAHALSYPLIKEAINTRVYLVRSEEGKEHFIQNTNHLLWSEDNMIGGKTGYTRTAKHCFVSASRIGNRLIYTAVLGDANRDKLWQDTQQLIVKADTILSGKSEPIVHLTEEKHIVKASYKPVNKVQEKQKIKSKKTSKSKKLKQKKTKNATNNTKSV
jgi:D-alanyl-D-alanine carboxypeptidase (penicillin-binding protein 5/6)